MRADDPLIQGQRGCCLNRFDSIVKDMTESHTVLVEEGCQCCSTGPFDLVQGRPTGNEVTEQERIDSIKPFKGLGIVLFECITQPISGSDPIID